MKSTRPFLTVTAALLAATILPGSLALTSLRAHEKEPPKADASPVAVYVCAMHPDVTDSKPSKCPKCGMTLVAKAQATPGAMSMDHDHGGIDMGGSHDHTAPTIKTEIVTAEPPAPGSRGPTASR